MEVARTIFEKHGHEIIYKNVPWARAVSQTAKGTFGAAIAVSYQPETKKMVLPEVPIVQYQLKAITDKKSDWT